MSVTLYPLISLRALASPRIQRRHKSRLVDLFLAEAQKFGDEVEPVRREVERLAGDQQGVDRLDAAQRLRPVQQDTRVQPFQIKLVAVVSYDVVRLTDQFRQPFNNPRVVFGPGFGRGENLGPDFRFVGPFR